MPRTHLGAYRAVAQLLRHRRFELGLTLREVVEQTGAAGQQMNFVTLSRIEQGDIDPGLKRLHALFQVYRLPLDIIGDLIDIDHLAGELPRGGSMEALYREGVAAWRRGELSRGLAHVLAVRLRAPATDADRLWREKALLVFSIMARNLGRQRLALRLAEELILDCVNPEILPNVYIQLATIWQEMGSSRMARVFLTEAEHLVAPDDHQRMAWILNSRAETWRAEGAYELAREAVAAGIARADAAGDTFGAARARHVAARIEFESGQDLARARQAAEDSLRDSEGHGHALQAVFARHQLAKVQLAQGEVDAGLATLDAALRERQALGDRTSTFESHFHLWKAHETFGDPARARFEREAALYFVTFVDEASPEAIEARRVAKGETEHVRPRRRVRRPRP